VKNQILRTLRIQTLPGNIQKISQVLDNPSSTVSDVSREIEKDPAMASQVLKLVNSGFCGLRGRVTAIRHAAAVLGFNTLKTVLLSATMNEKMKGPLAALWDHSLACSRTSSLLSRSLGIDQPEEVASAGLLHDIGKTILFECVPDKFEQITQLSQTHDIFSMDAENHILGLTHEETGSLLLNKWNIPENSIAAVAHHHSPGEAGEHSNRAALVHVADALVRAWGIGLGGEQHVPEISPDAQEILSLSTDRIRQIVSRMDEDLREIVQLPSGASKIIAL
jgi:putative nucleotidyltransferase with HDIG domain